MGRANRNAAVAGMVFSYNPQIASAFTETLLADELSILKQVFTA